MYQFPCLKGLPPIGANRYLEWNISDHEDPLGWYLATVIDHQADRQTYILYTNGQSKLFRLKSPRWHLTRKGGKRFFQRQQLYQITLGFEEAEGGD